MPTSSGQRRAGGVVDQLGRIELENDAGEDVRLADLWQDKPVVLVFLRHFG